MTRDVYIVTSKVSEASIAAGVIRSHLTTADKEASYWADELGIQLPAERSEPNSPGTVAKEFLRLVEEKYITTEQTGAAT